MAERMDDLFVFLCYMSPLIKIKKRTNEDPLFLNYMCR